MTDTREATPRPATEARERLARELYEAQYKSASTWEREPLNIRSVWFVMASNVLKALHLSDAAALALMDGGGRVVPIYPTDEMCDAAWESEGTDYVGEHHRIHCFGDAYTAALSASPYKETTNDR